MDTYEDIINLEHPTSRVHPRMSLYDRSAQFAPFAALTGYEDAICETKRLTDKKIILDEALKQIINDKLNILKNNINNRPIITITYFIKDNKKSGGSYKTISDNLRKININSQYLLLSNDLKINFDDILNIKSDLFKELEN